jgi:zinc protease
MASLTFMESLYKDHPYGRSIHGYIETIGRITRDDLAEFHRQQYGPKGMVIGISGAIPSEKALDKVSEAFGDWVNMRQPALPSVPDMPRPASEIVRTVSIPGKSQVDLILGLPGPRRSAPDYLHASLMNTVLGVFGMMGRIGRNVREEQGLAYYASSHLAGGLGPAPWSANAGTAPEDVDSVISGIKQEIAQMQNEIVPAAELADCKSYRVGSLPVSLETNTALADTLVDMELYDLGLDFLQRFPILIRSISAEQVQAAAQKYLSDEELVIALAGPLPVV